MFAELQIQSVDDVDYLDTHTYGDHPQHRRHSATRKYRHEQRDRDMAAISSFQER